MNLSYPVTGAILFALARVRCENGRGNDSTRESIDGR